MVCYYSDASIAIPAIAVAAAIPMAIFLFVDIGADDAASASIAA